MADSDTKAKEIANSDNNEKTEIDKKKDVEVAATKEETVTESGDVAKEVGTNGEVGTKASADEKSEEKVEGLGDDHDDIVSKVAQRLRFFFSDANIRQDHFMRKYLMPSDEEGTEEMEHPKHLPIELLMRFNTIKKLTTDEKIIIQAAKSLKDLLVVSSDNKAIGRVEEFTQDKMNDNIPLTLLVSNIPVQGEGERSKYSVLPDELRVLFEQYGPVALVKFRFMNSSEDEQEGNNNNNNNHGKKQQHHRGGGGGGRKSRVPSGSAFVEFESVDGAQKAAADTLTVKDGVDVEPKRKLKLGDSELKVMELQEYIASRKKTGAVVLLQMEGLSSDCDRESIMEAVAEALELSVDEAEKKRIRIDYFRGKPRGVIRFPDADMANKILQLLTSGDLPIGGNNKVESARILDGEEAEEYLKKKGTRDQQKNEPNSQQKNESNKKRDAPEDDQEDVELDWKPGCVVRIKGLPADCDREKIIDAVTKCLDVSPREVREKKIRADYSRGLVDGAIRFTDPQDATAVQQKLSSGDVKIDGKDIDSAEILTGEQETKYWSDFKAVLSRMKHHRDDEKRHRKKRRS